MSYPGLTGESAPLWIAKESGLFKEYGIDARLVYMEGGRLSIQSLLSNSTQFMTGDAVSALSAIAGGADIVLLASAKNVLPYVFAVSKDVRRPQELKGRIIATSQIGGRAGEIARMVIRNIGLDPDKDVTYLAVGGTMSRLAALSTGKVHAAPISQIVVPVAEERGLNDHATRAYSAHHRRALDIAKICRGESPSRSKRAARLHSGDCNAGERSRKVRGNYAQIHEKHGRQDGTGRLRTL